MRTYLFNTRQNTTVIEVETDAISNTQGNSTIHDINVLAGSLFQVQSNGFNINTLNQVSYLQLGALATALGMSLSVVNPETRVTTSIVAAGAFAISTASITGLQAGVAVSKQLSYANGCGSVVFTVKDGAELPVGLSISTSGLITGTTTEEGEVTFTIVVTDSLGQVAEKAYTTTIAAAA